MVHLLNSGEHMIAMDDLYGGSNRLFRKVVNPKMNIETSFVDMTNPEKVSPSFDLTNSPEKLVLF